jgi:hypothetical protein
MAEMMDKPPVDTITTSLVATAAGELSGVPAIVVLVAIADDPPPGQCVLIFTRWRDIGSRLP